MARPLRIEFPHAVYHITSRGNARQKIVREDDDRETFLEYLGGVVDRFDSECYASCLMDNHFHLVIETPRPTCRFIPPWLASHRWTLAPGVCSLGLQDREDLNMILPELAWANELPRPASGRSGPLPPLKKGD